MSPNQLQNEYHLLNSNLRKSAQETYTRFLNHLLRSLPVTPETTRIHGLLRARDYSGLLEFADSLASQKYEDAEKHFLANQLAALIRKYPFPPALVVTNAREKALQKFLKAERRCARMNKFFKLLQKRNPYAHGLERARAWIAYVLGDINHQEISDSCNWGPGAAVGVHGNATNMARKLLAKHWSVSPGAYNYARAYMKSDPLIFEHVNAHEGRFYSYDPILFNTRFESRVNVVTYNKIAFVPKTALVERTIAVEPSLNGFVQKGIDIFMRKRLKRVGIDLADQSRNQELARQGSLPDQDDPYVTIDLSSASDSISIELCRYILPPEWFELLDRVRSRDYSLSRGHLATYHKFCSMGNGFCFPLETLIFSALCATAYCESNLDHDFSVYGDDIIVRQSVASRVLELLRICGFTPNRDKTFLEGPFRESCGADWFEGKDVRPINLDYAFDSAESIFKFCNLVTRKELLKTFFGRTIDILIERIPRTIRLERPFEGTPDSALEVPLDRFLTSSFAQWDNNLSCWSWFEFVRGALGDRKISRDIGYPVALMRGALSGSPSSVPFAERRKTRTRVRRMAHSGASSLWLPICKPVSDDRYAGFNLG